MTGTRQSIIAGLVALAGVLSYQAATIAKEDQWSVHEWGTYTSVLGSDGLELPGLHHGDEALPSFVHCPGGSAQSYSGCLNILHPGTNPDLIVTQRLETPVIYFHSKQARDVQVDVEFPKGVFTEWYPRATSVVPAAGSLKAVREGTISWTASLKTEALTVPEVLPEEIWAPSRKVAANALTAGNENEQFIFYRGVGKFEPDFRVTSDSAGRLAITNKSPQPIAAAFLIQVGGDHGAIQSLGVIPAQGSISVAKPGELGAASLTSEQFLAQAGPLLKTALVASGLNDDESQAMVDTWTRSYFKTDGTRILYITPRAWADAILPIRFSPAPDELVRTLVGRVEVLGQSDETALLEKLRLAQIQAKADPNFYFDAVELGRFAEPKLWRAYALAQEPELKDYIAKIIGEQL